MAEETEEKKETRVTMIWPPPLKEAVRDKVGARGLTEFTLEAVRVRLEGEDRFQAQEARLQERESEIDKLRWLCQLLADRYAMGGDYENRVQGLMDIELPSWLSTEGWPEELAKLVPKKDAEPVTISGAPKAGKPWFKAPDGGWTADPEQAKQPLETVAPKVEEEPPADDVVEEDDLHRPMALTRPKVEKLKPEEAGFKLEAEPGDDFFAKVQAKAAEKGVDLSGANLKSASSIERPEQEVPTEPASVLDVLPEPPTEVAPEPAAADPNKCPNCGDMLVAGECWSC